MVRARRIEVANQIHLLPLGDTEVWAIKLVIALMLRVLDGAIPQKEIQGNTMEVVKVALKEVGKKLGGIEK